MRFVLLKNMENKVENIIGSVIITNEDIINLITESNAVKIVPLINFEGERKILAFFTVPDLKHKHKFYPINETRSKKWEKIQLDCAIRMCMDIRSKRHFGDMERRWVCECGKTKWVKEKK